MKSRWILTLTLAAGINGGAQALEIEGVYVGGGVSVNSLKGFDNALGLQIFAGLPLTLEMLLFNSALEVGYMDSGNFERPLNCATGTCYTKNSASGVWANYVASLPINSQMELLGRVGIDVGDDNGLMAGIGFGFNLDHAITLRAEYVSRDTVDSMQLNLTYQLP